MFLPLLTRLGFFPLLHFNADGGPWQAQGVIVDFCVVFALTSFLHRGRRETRVMAVLEECCTPSTPHPGVSSILFFFPLLCFCFCIIIFSFPVPVTGTW